MPQLRRNPVTGEWVVVAPERAKRPNDYFTAESVKPESKVDCVFCPDGKEFEEFQKRDTKFENEFMLRQTDFPLLFMTRRSEKLDLTKLKHFIGLDQA